MSIHVPPAADLLNGIRITSYAGQPPLLRGVVLVRSCDDVVVVFGTLVSIHESLIAGLLYPKGFLAGLQTPRKPPDKREIGGSSPPRPVGTKSSPA